MKLLPMPARRSPVAALLPRIWATEGNLATAVSVMHSPAVRSEPKDARRSPFRVVIHPRTAFYRRHTEGMLRRYGVAALQKGRVPSLLGRELFRGRVTSYRMRTFEDVIIFVADVERCIGLLAPDQQNLIIRVAVQEYTLPETAAMLRWSLRSTIRRYHEAVDELTAIFQARGLMERTPGLHPPATEENSCQETELSGVTVTYTAENT